VRIFSVFKAHLRNIPERKSSAAHFISKGNTKLKSLFKHAGDAGSLTKDEISKTTDNVFFIFLQNYSVNHYKKKLHCGKLNSTFISFKKFCSLL